MQVVTSDSENKAEDLQTIIDHAVTNVGKGNKAIAESKAHYKAGEKATEEAEKYYKAAGVHIAQCKKLYKRGSNRTWAQFCKERLGMTARRADELIMIGDGRTTLQKVRAKKKASMRKVRSKSEPRGSHSAPPPNPPPKPEEFCRAGFLSCAAEATAHATNYDLGNVTIDQDMVDAGQKVVDAWTARVQTLRAVVAQGGDDQPASMIPAANGAAA
jgi:hypothetical protein